MLCRLSIVLLCMLLSTAAGRRLTRPDPAGVPGESPYPEERNAATTADGLPLIESDLLLEPAADRTDVLMEKLWPLGEPVPYVITAEVEVRRPQIEAALQHWENNTCVTFTELPVHFSGAPHLRFISGSGCYSFLGRLKNKLDGQVVSIGPGCGSLVTTAHEIAHSLGFFHEQSRKDRDQHVEVMWDNIKPKFRPNFNIKPKGEASVPYDLRSIMHYSTYMFALDRSKPTLRAVDPLEQHLVGRRMGRMTHRDMAGANIAYSCSAHCVDPPVCQHGGYVDKTCRCVCPEGITGKLCETMPADYRYYGPLCGDVNITTPGPISAEFDRADTTPHDCYWLVTAPQGQQVRLAFGGVSMNQWPRCNHDIMRVSLEGDLRDTAASGCGGQLSDTQHESIGGRVLVYFRTRGGSRRPRHFTAEVTFVPAE